MGEELSWAMKYVSCAPNIPEPRTGVWESLPKITAGESTGDDNVEAPQENGRSFIQSQCELRLGPIE